MASRNSNLLQIIDGQKQEIEKYKTKLRDVVSAFKSLQKEKLALEESLQAIRSERSDAASTEDISDSERRRINETEDAKQVSALVNSLATLTTGKAQMEASFQADKKKLREEKELVEQKCEELIEQLGKSEQKIEEWRSKLIVERHERDKEQADHGAIMKELQTVLATERSARIGLEETLADLRKQNAEAGGVSVERYERKIARLRNELELTHRKLELFEKKDKEPPRELAKLQGEIRNLQIEHQTAMQQERKRAEEVEERAKKNALVQEERVINLETKLADLSAIVGTYDRLRQEDQAEIVKLKEHIAAAGNTVGMVVKMDQVAYDYEEIEKESEYEKSAEEIKEWHVNTENNKEDIHDFCKEELLRAKIELEACKREFKASNEPCGNKVEELVKSLQERVRKLNDEAALKDKQHRAEVEQLKLQLRTEKVRFKETLAAAETDFRGRLNLLETQLQKLRERSLALLEDKEQEIHSLQGTFQAFLPGARQQEAAELPSLTSMRDGPRMLHYANELARRDVDLASQRRAKHKLEATLRDLQRAVMADAEKHREERQSLREEIARLERCQTREGANLEYLKNVVLSFLISNDPCSKRHMCNAIAAVLKFSESEQDKISKQTHNSWWTAGNKV